MPLGSGGTDLTPLPASRFRPSFASASAPPPSSKPSELKPSLPHYFFLTNPSNQSTDTPYAFDVSTRNDTLGEPVARKRRTVS